MAIIRCLSLPRRPQITCSGGNGKSSSCSAGGGKAKWLLLFRQTMPKIMNKADQWKSVNKNNPKAPNYSILNQLSDKHKTNGKFTFKLVWPRRKGKNYNTWRQSSNPVKDKMGAKGYDSYEAMSLRDMRLGTSEAGLRMLAGGDAQLQQVGWDHPDSSRGASTASMWH